MSTTLELVIITDPGPDPDDIKTLLAAGIAHKRQQIVIRGVICNGGRQPRARAKLAQRVFELLGISDVPVGVGSDGQPYEAKEHEFELEGYADVDESELLVGVQLMQTCLEQARTKALTILCISGLRDFADVIEDSPELVLDRVQTVAIMGGVEFSASEEANCLPDTTANNVWDMDAAKLVYRFCFTRGLQMTVTNGAAIPCVPMSLAASFSESNDCPVMRYLHRAQYLGLVGLWERICVGGDLPARCTKRWFFEMFCGVDGERFDAEHLHRLEATDDIKAFLDGTVKPYDVVALMTVLPTTRALFSGFASHEVQGVRHLLLMRLEHAIDAQAVIDFLRETFTEVVRITATTARSVG